MTIASQRRCPFTVHRRNSIGRIHELVRTILCKDLRSANHAGKAGTVSRDLSGEVSGKVAKDRFGYLVALNNMIPVSGATQLYDCGESFVEGGRCCPTALTWSPVPTFLTRADVPAGPFANLKISFKNILDT
jgi:hypothetical protein